VNLQATLSPELNPPTSSGRHLLVLAPPKQSDDYHLKTAKLPTAVGGRIDCFPKVEFFQARACSAQPGVSPEEAERRDFVPGSPRGDAVCRMVDAAEVAFVVILLASEKLGGLGQLVAASSGGRSVYY
jgi:hypothetical protein